MAPAEPLTDKHAVGDQTEADAVSVISDDEDIEEHPRKDAPLPPEVERGPEDEPFETLKHKASKLILDLFPGYCARDVKI